jgi:uncharacterized membrane protein
VKATLVEVSTDARVEPSATATTRSFIAAARVVRHPRVIMLVKLRAAWARLLGTLWFVPGAIGLGGVALAVLMVDVSARVDAEALARFPRVFGASADSSRSLLSAIASSIITVAGLTFSLTMLAVTQASSQFTPRILRTFMRDRATQIVLGTFVGVFAYCVVVLRTIRSVEEVRFVPSLAVVLGIVLALAGMGALVFFVHHIASTLQASRIIERVAAETVEAIDHRFPESVGEEASEAPADADAALADLAWQPVAARRSGYLQAVDADGLLGWAVAHDAVVRLEAAIGDFVIEATPVAWVALARDTSGDEDDDLRGAVAGRFTVGTYRTVDQDAAFGVRQIVDIALKALSPGVNDTTTAVTCVDWLGALLVRVADRRVETPVRAVDGRVRVIARGTSFEQLLRLTVDEIRQSAAGNVSILARLQEMLARVGATTRARARRQLLAEQVRLVDETAGRTVDSAHDRARLAALADRARAATGGAHPFAAPPSLRAADVVHDVFA